MVWTFPEIITAAEARLRVLGTQMERLSQAGTTIMMALWLGAVVPRSFTRLARWLEGSGPSWRGARFRRSCWC